jgi:hypothetical protein
VEANGFEVVCAVVTHNDADHWDGLRRLLRRRGWGVRGWGILQDRPARSCRDIIHELERGVAQRLWVEPFSIAPQPNTPDELLDKPGVKECKRPNGLRLVAVYPTILAGLRGQLRGPNYAGALLVLYDGERPLVAWPGDLPLEICHQELVRAKIRPMFLVGPHHGGPQDLRRTSQGDVAQKVREIGHDQLWVSVAWHRGRRLPRENYLRGSRSAGVTIRCSQLTEHCDPEFERFSPGLVPMADWLGIDPPPNGVSCMGPMRVTFADGKAEIAYENEHKMAVTSLHGRLCFP